MATQEGPERKRSSAKPDEETGAAIGKARPQAKAALAPAKNEERAKQQAEEMLAESQPALAEARRATGIEAGSGEEGSEKPVSFVVRVTIDERGQPLRTEIEHTRTKDKLPFQALDGQKLVDFIKRHISLPANPQPTILPAPSSAGAGAPEPETPTPASRVTISDVQISRGGTPGVITLTLNSAEAFMIQARFRLQGPKASAVVSEDPSFEIKVYAKTVTGGASNLLTTYTAKLVKDVLDYTAQMQASGLAPGLYRLVTLVTVHSPVKMVGYYEGPLVAVSANLLSGGQTTPSQIVLHE